jgi:aminomethyltransferase
MPLDAVTPGQPRDSAQPALFAQPLRHSPFYARARAACTRDQFVAWAGYSTVDVYTSVEQEYFAIRNGCSIYDLSPMSKYDIDGADAEAFLNRLVARDVRKIRPSRVAYSVWCDDSGRLVADGTIFRISETHFMLCAAEHQLDWLMTSAVGFNVSIQEVTRRIAALSVQGPTSCAVLKQFGVAGVETLKPFQLREFTVDGRAMMVSRSGFTGDLGYEVWVSPDDAHFLWDGLMAAGSDRAIRPIGTQALNMARIEAGLVMQDADFISAETAAFTGGMYTPLELGLSRFVDFEKGHFTGRRALLAATRAGPKRCLVGLDIEGHHPAPRALVYADRGCRREVGALSSAIWSPTCKRNIGLAMLDAGSTALGSALWVEIYFMRELQRERRIVRGVVVESRFFAPPRARRTPPADV